MRNSQLDSQAVRSIFLCIRPTVTLQYLFARPTFLDTDKNIGTYTETRFFRLSPTFGGRSATTTDIFRKGEHIQLVQRANA